MTTTTGSTSGKSWRKALLRVVAGSATSLAVASAALAQDAVLPGEPSPTTPPRPQQPVTMPRVEPLKIERPRYTNYSGFQRPSAFTYQGPKNFTRPTSYYGPRPPEVPIGRGGSMRPVPAPAGSGVHLPTVDVVRAGPGVPVRPDGFTGTDRGIVSDRRTESPVATRDPFSTRYPINEVTHTVLSNDGTIRTFTTINPNNAFARSYDRRYRGPWELFSYDNGRFNARGYMNTYGLYDPYRCRYYRPFSEMYIGPGVGTADVLYGQTYTVEEHRAANSGIIPGSQQAPPDDPGPTLIEEVIASFDAGHPEVAIPRIREHLMSNPDDTAAHRILALALLMDKDLPQGLAELAGSYAQDPGLAAAPIDLDYFHIRRAALTDTTGRVIAYAKRNHAPMAYFAAAVIQQARGEIPVARKMLELAIKAGLDPELSSALSGALSPKAAATNPAPAPGTPAPVGGAPGPISGEPAPTEKPGPR